MCDDMSLSIDLNESIITWTSPQATILTNPDGSRVMSLACAIDYPTEIGLSYPIYIDDVEIVFQQEESNTPLVSRIRVVLNDETNVYAIRNLLATCSPTGCILGNQEIPLRTAMILNKGDQIIILIDLTSASESVQVASILLHFTSPPPPMTRQQQPPPARAEIIVPIPVYPLHERRARFDPTPAQPVAPVVVATDPVAVTATPTTVDTHHKEHFIDTWVFWVLIAIVVLLCLSIAVVFGMKLQKKKRKSSVRINTTPW